MKNLNELVLERVRSVVAHDPATGSLQYRLTSIEDPSLKSTSESDEVTDALGSVITTLYKAKKATFSGSNSILSLDLAAAQFGSKKEIGSENNKITDCTYEILTIKDGKVALKNAPIENTIHLYSIEDGVVGTEYKQGSAVSATEFLYDNTTNKTTDEPPKVIPTIKTPTGLTGKVYIEYNFENADAIQVRNNASQFPSTSNLVIHSIFSDKCNDNIKYAGKIIGEKAKLNPASLEYNLTSTGKHPFEYNFSKDYCADEGEDELFRIIVSQ